VDTCELVLETLKRKVLFVPGRDFFPNASGQRFMRLNFSNATPEQIRVGVGRLAEVCTTAVAPLAVIASS
jgi:2-aminoadipate transaminase